MREQEGGEGQGGELRCRTRGVQAGAVGLEAPAATPAGPAKAVPSPSPHLVGDALVALRQWRALAVPARLAAKGADDEQQLLPRHLAPQKKHQALLAAGLGWVGGGLMNVGQAASHRAQQAGHSARARTDVYLPGSNRLAAPAHTLKS